MALSDKADVSSLSNGEQTHFYLASVSLPLASMADVAVVLLVVVVTSPAMRHRETTRRYWLAYARAR